MKLRPYQEQAVDAILREFETAQSTLLVLPTGGGKTQVFCEVAKRMLPKRTLIVAHREELIFQAKARAEAFGLNAEVEMAALAVKKSLFGAPDVVVTSIQTQVCGGSAQEGRMQRFDPNEFGLVVIDECHRAATQSYGKLLDYYKQNPSIKVLGVTATPDRTDEAALGAIFETVAYEYDILEAIDEGWLVPIDQQCVGLKSLDFSECRTTAGDLNLKDLSQVVEQERNLHAVAAPASEIIMDKKTLVFCASVKQASDMTNLFRRYGHQFDFLHAGTPKEERREILDRYRAGKIQGICNVGIMTEGVDVPEIEVVVMARPTKSRIVYSQAIGRGTRPLPGVVDGLDTPEERKAAIAGSAKPSVLVLDFVGNAGRHRLVHCGDILSGKLPEDVVDRFQKRAAQSGKRVNVRESLEEIRCEIEQKEKERQARLLKLTATARYTSQRVDPFSLFGLSKAQPARGWDNGKQLSEKQRVLLIKQGIDPTKMPYGDAKRLINEQFRRWDLGLCSFKQAKLLARFGYNPKDMKREAASAIIDQIAANGWKPLEVPAIAPG